MQYIMKTSMFFSHMGATRKFPFLGLYDVLYFLNAFCWFNWTSTCVRLLTITCIYFFLHKKRIKGIFYFIFTFFYFFLLKVEVHHSLQMFLNGFFIGKWFTENFSWDYRQMRFNFYIILSYFSFFSSLVFLKKKKVPLCFLLVYY